MEIIDSLATALALLLFVFFLEKNKAPEAQILYTSAFVGKVNSSYFEPLAHTLNAGKETLDEQLRSQPEAAHAAINVKRHALDNLQLQLAQAKERFVI